MYMESLGMHLYILCVFSNSRHVFFPKNFLETSHFVAILSTSFGNSKISWPQNKEPELGH